MTPPEGNTFLLYAPLIALALVYGLVFLTATVLGNRRGPEARERMLDVAFGVGLLAAAYTLVLLIVALVTLPDLVVDLVRIMLVVGAFFAVLLSLLFALFELIFGRGARRVRGVQSRPVAERSADSSSG